MLPIRFGGIFCDIDPVVCPEQGFYDIRNFMQGGFYDGLCDSYYSLKWVKG